MSEPLVLTVAEAADLLRVSHWTIGAMVRDRRLPRVPGLRRIRIPRGAVLAMAEGYYAGHGEPNGPPSPKAPTSRRRVRYQADRPVATTAVGSSDPLHRPIGPKAGDVVVRVVEGRSR